MVNEVLAVLLDKNHLRHKVSRLLSKTLLPDDSDRLGAPKSGNKLTLRKEALGALVVLANPLQTFL